MYGMEQRIKIVKHALSIYIVCWPIQCVRKTLCIYFTLIFIRRQLFGVHVCIRRTANATMWTKWIFTYLPFIHFLSLPLPPPPLPVALFHSHCILFLIPNKFNLNCLQPAHALGTRQPHLRWYSSLFFLFSFFPRAIAIVFALYHTTIHVVHFQIAIHLIFLLLLILFVRECVFICLWTHHRCSHLAHQNTLLISMTSIHFPIVIKMTTYTHACTEYHEFKILNSPK